ncbi:sodium- and chloride-dependent glycine transporter 1-like [Haliotis rufescens]|uniref:sodium- and chloride-dependent glycine transporter 1-like n=1 Tax=Haliotis rufescens TaxID=6454 RepID=UPI00201FAD91|nr:sodium- and chloride-dependent glycine transporter 1-like [Haliotis rufescens]
MTIVQYQSPTYGKYTYPGEATVVGWVIALLPVIPIPIMMIIELRKQRGSTLRQKLMLSLQPNIEWSPAEVSLASKYRDSLIRNRRTFSGNLSYIFKFETNNTN